TGEMSLTCSVSNASPVTAPFSTVGWTRPSKPGFSSFKRAMTAFTCAAAGRAATERSHAAAAARLLPPRRRFAPGRAHCRPAGRPGALATGRGVELLRGIGWFRRGQPLGGRLAEEVAHLGVGPQQLLDLAAQLGVAPASRVQVGGALGRGPLFQGGEKQGFHG